MTEGNAMTALANRRVAYFNGKIVPEREVVVPFRDRSFLRGDAVFDSTRTFGGKPFRLQQHIDRLYRSLRYLRIDPGLSPAEMLSISEEVLSRNAHLLDASSDYWISQRITRGADAAGDEGWDHLGPTVIVECMPLPLKKRARLYRDGIDVVVPSVRRTSPDAFSPRAKTHNYLNLTLGELEAQAVDPQAWAVMLDVNGNLAEGTGSNIFLVRDGALYTPREQYVLPGISRRVVMELARDEGIPLSEIDLDLYDAATADEIFITSTSLCICPVRAVNGNPVGTGVVPGALTKRLTQAYVRHAEFDFVAQYLRHLDVAESGR
jgi:branched-chain amino acid aminotransferase